jgi:3D (Asp-Asp-Asp) domain-containing protein
MANTLILIIVIAALSIAAVAPVCVPYCPAVYAGQSKNITIKQFRVTAYCPCEICCGKYADGITASGHRIKPGDKFTAADKTIPFGTRLDIPGYGLVEVKDRGGKIKGDRLDVFFDTHQEALNWGVQYLDVTVFDSDGAGD